MDYVSMEIWRHIDIMQVKNMTSEFTVKCNPRTFSSFLFLVFQSVYQIEEQIMYHSYSSL
jgi:hypothetical protein